MPGLTICPHYPSATVREFLSSIIVLKRVAISNCQVYNVDISRMTRWLHGSTSLRYKTQGGYRLCALTCILYGYRIKCHILAQMPNNGATLNQTVPVKAISLTADVSYWSRSRLQHAEEP